MMYFLIGFAGFCIGGLWGIMYAKKHISYEMYCLALKDILCLFHQKGDKP